MSDPETRALFEAPEPPSFPPLITGEALAAGDPFTKAVTRATLGCDSGLLIHQVTADRVAGAIVFAPEVALERALAVLPACALGLQNALGALVPPEVAVGLGWDGTLFVNGAAAGRLRVAASAREPQAVPDWLVVGMEVALIPAADQEGGRDVTRTSLIEEGCGDLSPIRLLESWSRHLLVWLNRLEDEGTGPLIEEWRGLSHEPDEALSLRIGGQVVTGRHAGLGEDFTLLLRQGENTRAIALDQLLEEAP